MNIEGTLVGGRYRLDQPIGHGRAGIVWMAHDTRLNRTVAAKRMFIPPDLDPALAEQAKSVAVQEGRMATTIAHGCVITVHEVVREDNQPWLIMEYVPSRNMSDFLTEHGLLAPEQAAFLGIQLASALIAAHQAGVVHRALEPGNVLLADDGGVKITDIGITGAGADPTFQAPEVRAGGKVSVAADAFSLGATLYAAVEGEAPYGESGEDDLRRPRAAGPLTGALLKLLRTDPTVRPTMADTIRALTAITRGQQTAFIPPTAPTMPVPRNFFGPQPAPATPKPRKRAGRSRVRAWWKFITSSPTARSWVLGVLGFITLAAIVFGIFQIT